MEKNFYSTVEITNIFSNLLNISCCFYIVHVSNVETNLSFLWNTRCSANEVFKCKIHLNSNCFYNCKIPSKKQTSVVLWLEKLERKNDFTTKLAIVQNLNLSLLDQIQMFCFELWDSKPNQTNNVRSLHRKRLCLYTEIIFGTVWWYVEMQIYLLKKIRQR